MQLPRSLLNILDIDYAIIEKLQYKDITFLNYHIEENTEFMNYVENAVQKSSENKERNKSAKDTKATPIKKLKSPNHDYENEFTILDELYNLKKLIVSYKIYSAFYNFIGHLLNTNELGSQRKRN